jgi:hypothetical protein
MACQMQVNAPEGVNIAVLCWVNTCVPILCLPNISSLHKVNMSVHHGYCTTALTQLNNMAHQQVIMSAHSRVILPACLQAIMPAHSRVITAPAWMITAPLQVITAPSWVITPPLWAIMPARLRVIMIMPALLQVIKPARSQVIMSPSPFVGGYACPFLFDYASLCSGNYASPLLDEHVCL